MKSFLKALIKSPVAWVLFLYLEPSLAHAADMSIFTIPAGDLSKQYLDRLFPADGVSSPFASILQIINASALMIGGVLMSYAFFHHIMSAASTGEVSKKFGSAWFPIRVALPSALMMPISAKGGLCAASYLVLWVFSQSIGLADTIYTTWQKNSASLVYSTQPVNHEDAKKLFLTMMKYSVCTASLKKANDQYSLKYFTSTGAAPAFGITENNTPAGLELFYGNNTDPDQISSCGKIFLEDPDATLTAVAGDVLSSKIDTPQYYALQDVRKAVFEQKKIQLLAASQKLGETASVFVFNRSTKILPTVIQTTNDYELAIKKSVVKEASKNAEIDKVNKALVNQGWISLGFTFLHAATFQRNLSDIVGSLPSDASNDGTNFVNNDIVKNDVAAFQNEVDKEEADSSQLGLKQAGQMDQGDDGGVLAFVKDPMGHLAKIMVHELANGNFIIGSTNSSPNILLSSSALGGKMLYMANVILVLPLAASAFIPAGTTSAILGITLPLAASLIVGGVLLQTFLPLEPTIIWYSIIISIFLSFIEAMVAAPFWMLAHLHGENQEHGSSGEGYKLLMGLFLSVPMAVVAFCVSIVVLQLASDLIFSTFSDAIDIGRGTPMNVWSLLGVGALFVSLMLSIVGLVFTEIYSFGDRVNRWLGLGLQNSIAGHAQEMRSQSGQHKTAIMGAVVATKSSIGRGAGDIHNQNERNKEIEKQANITRPEKTERTYTAPEKPGESMKPKPPSK